VLSSTPTGFTLVDLAEVRRFLAALVAHRALQLQALGLGYLPRCQRRPSAGIPRRVLLSAQPPQPAPDLFRHILNRCLLYTEPATYALLTAT
jgi:hypothetical protein